MQMPLNRRDAMAIMSGLAANMQFMGAAIATEATSGAPTSHRAGGLLSWKAYIDMLEPAGQLISQTWEPDSEILRADLYRSLMMNLSSAYFFYFQADPEHPDFSPLWNNVYLMQPNPDDNYVIAPVRGDRTYRISGDRGTVRMVIFQVSTNLIGVNGQSWRHVLEADLDSAELVKPDGTFEFLLSASRPPGYVGHWFALDPASEFVWFRQVAYDWIKEIDARIAIECLDGNPIKTRLSVSETDSRLRQMLVYAKNFTQFWINYQHKLKASIPVNTFRFSTFGDQTMTRQTYWEGIFELKENEAIILETDLPETRPYWNVQLNDTLFNTLEYAYAQSSLNDAQAHVDSDGKFRAVISVDDPGVPNWLDTVGFHLGTIIGRWYRCSSQPMPTLKRVPFADIRVHVPPDTPTVTPAQRSEAIHRRVRGIQLRRRW
jgi:hypothetical protein